MAQKFKLKRTIQCAKCPWKVSTNPLEIPGGYSEEKHENLEKSIAKEGDYDFSKPLVIMACHHSREEMEHCVGWVNNQLNIGNNIQLRIKMRDCENIRDLKVTGKQHTNFKDTLPKH